jgi:hypothetical protein
MTSIGCGCGFLEWLLSEATDLEVGGIEVNEAWWRSKHATPQRIPIQFVEAGCVPEIVKKNISRVFLWIEQL